MISMIKRNKTLAMIVVSILVLVIGLSVQSALNQGATLLSVFPEVQYQLAEGQNSISTSGISQLVTQYVNESISHNHHKSFSLGLKNDVTLLNSGNNISRIANYFESQSINISQVRVGTSFDQNTGNVHLYIYAEPLSGSLIKKNNYSYIQSYRNLIGFGINDHHLISAPMNIQFTVGITNLTSLSDVPNANVSMSQSSRTNWDGYQNQNSQNCISSACADITAPGFEKPSYYCPCPSYPAISAWIGLSGGSGGTNCLAQTGYEWEWVDANHHPCAFYEIYGSQASCLYAGQSCSHGILNGNTIAAGVYHVSNGFYFCVADLSNGLSWSTTDTAHSFAPHYVQYIVEAPKTNGQISQIATFSSIQFSNMYYWGGQIPLNFVTTFYEQGQYDYYYLSQYYGDQNIGNYMNVQTNTWTATYINSYYNYEYVNGGPCGASGGCVAKGSMILTAKGYRPIQSIKIGTEVYEYNYTSGKMSLGRLLYKNSTFDNATISINKGFLRVTLTNQPIYIVNSSFEGWVINPDHLKVGDYLFDPINHNLIKIYSIKIVEKKIEVYDVITSLFNNFIDHGVLLDRKIPNPTV